MFALEQPAMALNCSRLKARFNMEINRIVEPNEGISSILGSVVAAAKAQPEGKLKNLIILCHGDPGILYLGTNISREHTSFFSELAPGGKPLVERIYLIACQVAQIKGPGSRSDGNLFCCEIAKNAKCTVVASTADQSTMIKQFPYGLVDQMEGTTLTYGPQGNVLSAHTNPMFHLLWPVE